MIRCPVSKPRQAASRVLQLKHTQQVMSHRTYQRRKFKKAKEVPKWTSRNLDVLNATFSEHCDDAAATWPCLTTVASSSSQLQVRTLAKNKAIAAKSAVIRDFLQCDWQV